MDLRLLYENRDLTVDSVFHHYYKTDGTLKASAILDLIKKGSYSGRYFMEGDPHAASLYYIGCPLIEVDYSASMINDNNKFSRAFIDGKDSISMKDAVEELKSLNVSNNLIEAYKEVYMSTQDDEFIDTIDGPISRSVVPVLSRIYKELRGKKHGGQVILTDNLDISDLVAIYVCEPKYEKGAVDELASGHSLSIRKLISINLTDAIYDRGDSELFVGASLLNPHRS